MGLYDGIKDVARVLQQTDNIELYKQLLDLSAQALELQAENTKLIEENKKLNELIETEKKIIRHKHPYLTIDGEDQNIKYCAICWGKEKKLIQMEFEDKVIEPHLICLNCKGICSPE